MGTAPKVLAMLMSLQACKSLLPACTTVLNFEATAGNFSFPNVPPNAALVYDVQLLGFEPVDEVSP